MRGLSPIVAVVFAGLLSGPAGAGVLIDFSEIPLGTSINGTTIKGASFTFEVGGMPSFDAVTSNLGPGVTPLSAPPYLEGNSAGLLTASWQTPVHALGFSFFLNSSIQVPQGVAIRLFDENGVNFDSFFPDLAPTPINSAVAFTYSGGTPVARLTVDPNESLGASRFIVDNLQFQPIPEPAAALAAGFLLLRRRRR